MLNNASTDFEAISFFQNCREEIRQIARQDKAQKYVQKALAIAASKRSIQNTQKLDRMLLNNILVDFLKAYKLDYTYSVFLRECNMVSEDVVSKKMLASILQITQEYDNEERFNVSVVQLLINAVQKSRRRSNNSFQFGAQVDLIQNNGQVNHILLLQNRMREVREEVEQREKIHYTKLLQRVKETQIMSLRENISKEYEEKFKKDSEKITKQFQELAKAAKAGNTLELKGQIETLLTKNHQLKTENQRIQEENKQLHRYKLGHSCQHTNEWKQLEAANKEERRELQSKKRQLDLALRNISTKVEDLVSQKKKLDQLKKPEQFLQEVRTVKQNKDHMIETIHAEMRQMNKRLQILSQENNTLMRELKQLREKEKYLKKPEKTQTEDKQTEKCRACILADKFKKQKKDVMISVSVTQIEAQMSEGIKQPDVVPEEEDDGNEEALLEQQNKIAQLHSDMKLIKNKIRLLVQNF